MKWSKAFSSLWRTLSLDWPKEKQLIWLERQGHFISRQCFVESLKNLLHITEVVIRFGIIGFERYGLVVTRKSFIKAFEFQQSISSIIVRSCERRLQCNRLVIVSDS